MKLFISYSHNDQRDVEELVRYLQRGGHEAWFDHHLRPGQRWETVLKEQVTSCGAFVYVVSRDSLKSEWCKREYRIAKRVKLDIIPVLIDKNAESEMPSDLKKYQYADCSKGYNTENVADLLGGLGDIEKKLIAQQARQEQLTELQKPRKRQAMPSEFSGVTGSMRAQLMKLKETEQKYLRNLKEQANEYIKEQRWDKALTKQQEIVENEGPTAENYSVRAIIYAKLGNIKNAMLDFDSAIKIDPQELGIYINRGLVYFLQKEYDKAIMDFTEVIQLDPQNGAAYWNRGLVHHTNGKKDEAFADYTEAIKFDPNYAVEYNNRGNLYKDNKEYDKALTDYNEAIRLDPKLADAYSNRATLLFLMKQSKEALADIEKACQLSSNNVLFHNNRAFLLFQLGQYDEAKKAWQKSVELEDVPSYTFAGYAAVLEHLKNTGEATKQYKEAIRLEKRWKNDLETVAKVYMWTDDMIGLAQEILKRL